MNQRLLGSNPHLGAAGRRVMKFVADNRELVLASSAAELGAKTGTSDATVVRTIQAAGFDGFGDLKRAILAALTAVSTPADNMRRTLADLEKTTDAALENVLQSHADGIEILASATGRAQIAAAVHILDSARRIVVFGIGPSAALASYASTLLARNGRASRSLHVTGAMLADQLLDLQEGDALLAMAYGDVYREAKAVFNAFGGLGLPSVLMTDAADNGLASMADAIVVIPRGRRGNMALHGATLVGLEALVLSLAAAKPDAALISLDRLNELRQAIGSDSEKPKSNAATASLRRRK